MADSQTVAREVANFYSSLPQVEAVVVSGSSTSGNSDPFSDLDLYIYLKEAIPEKIRKTFVTSRSIRHEIDNRFWESGDEWFETDHETAVDVMFRTPEWLKEQLDRVLVNHTASIGYSTCFWHNVLRSRILFDRNGWFKSTQQYAEQPFPEALRIAIVKKNHPILRRNISSYLHQIERALHRKDTVSVNHRVAALLASYFDILFALNRIPHPGEKRLIAIAEQQCKQLPKSMRQNVEELLRGVGNPDGKIIESVNALMDSLDELLIRERLIPT